VPSDANLNTLNLAHEKVLAVAVQLLKSVSTLCRTPKSLEEANGSLTLAPSTLET
jgi:hypothetical protein